MRILFLNHNPAGIGTWQRASQLGRALAARGHQVTLVTTHPSRRLGFEESVEDSYTELRAPDLLPGAARTGWDPSNALRRLLRLRGSRFDLVHAFDSRPVVIGPALDVARRTGAALFLDWADWWGRGGRIQERSGWLVRTFFSPVETWFEEAFRTRADGTTAISRALAERAAGLGVDPERTWILPNGCDPDGVQPVSRALARRRLEIDPDTRLIVHVGVLTPADMAQLAGALEILGGRLPKLVLALVGNHKAPVPRRLLESGRLRVTGFVSKEELLDWLGAADVCVIPLTDTPNNRGRSPIRINDYLAAGRATVMPRVGDAAALVDEHQVGWTCAPSADGMAEALLTALHAPEARAKAEERARALAEGPLRWTVMGQRLEEAYDSVLLHRISANGNGGPRSNGAARRNGSKRPAPARRRYDEAAS